MNSNDDGSQPGMLDAPSPRAAASPEKPRNVKCEYAHFDPKTLEPLNEATMRRALEVGFEAADFDGKTVLDIGCHSGFLSFLAARRGARSVKAYDVLAPFIEELNAAAAENGLPVTGAVKAFNKLDPAVDAADIVLLFEVIHWLVAKGETIPSVIAKVAALTRERLFLEFPWDVTEPSIQAKTSLTRQDYDSSLIFRELCRYFETVTLRQFMTYFGATGPSVRALVRASGKKKGALLVQYLPDLTGLEIKLSWSRGNSTYLEGRPRSYIAKNPAPESALRSVDPSALTSLLDELHGSRPHLLLLPLKLGERYVQSDASGERFFVFEWIGAPPLGDRPTLTIETPRLLEIATQLTVELARVSPELIGELRRSALLKKLTRAELERRVSESAALVQFSDDEIGPFLRLADSIPEESYRHVCHGDVNTSNIVGTEDAPRMVDFDNLMLGSPYTDVGTVLAMRAATRDEIAASFERLSHELAIDPPGRADVLFAIYPAFGWLSVIAPRLDPQDEDLRILAEKRASGLRALIDYGNSLRG